MRMPGYFTVILMPLALIWSFEAAAQQASEGGLRKTAFGMEEYQPSGMLENHCGDGGKPAVVKGTEITSGFCRDYQRLFFLIWERWEGK